MANVISGMRLLSQWGDEARRRRLYGADPISRGYPKSWMAADIRDCDSEGALIRAAWRWWSTPVG